MRVIVTSSHPFFFFNLIPPFCPQIRTVDRAAREVFENGSTRRVKTLPLVDRVLLASLALEARYGGPESTAGATLSRALDLMAAGGHPRPTPDLLLARLATLGTRRLILVGPLADRLAARVALNVPTRDLCLALGADPEVEWMHNSVKACMA